MVGDLLTFDQMAKYYKSDIYPIYVTEDRIYVRTTDVIYDYAYYSAYMIRHKTAGHTTKVAQFRPEPNYSRFITRLDPRIPGIGKPNVIVRYNPFGKRFELSAHRNIEAGEVLCVRGMEVWIDALKFRYINEEYWKLRCERLEKRFEPAMRPPDVSSDGSYNTLVDSGITVELVSSDCESETASVDSTKVEV